jgi:hypothetical protein
MRSELGRQIAVDFKSDADLDKRWGGPGHVTSSSCDHVARQLRLRDGIDCCAAGVSCWKSRIQTRSVRKLLPQLSADENVPSAIFMLDLARVFREKRVAADRPQGASESNIKGKGL